MNALRNSKRQIKTSQNIKEILKQSLILNLSGRDQILTLHVDL